MSDDERIDCLERERMLLRKALIGLVGIEDKSQLELMEAVVRTARIPELDRVNTINAIQALIITAD